jgi:hypothetical protein
MDRWIEKQLIIAVVGATKLSSTHIFKGNTAITFSL